MELATSSKPGVTLTPVHFTSTYHILRARYTYYIFCMALLISTLVYQLVTLKQDCARQKERHAVLEIWITNN